MTSSLDVDLVTRPLSADVDLPLGDQAPALARRTITGVLRSWGIDDEGFTDDVLLLTSELVGNAVRHGGVRVALGLSLDGGRLTLGVSDGSSVLPAQRDDDDEESGRGLLIIKAIADEWGVTECPGGKTVWVKSTGPGASLGRPSHAA